MAKPYFAEKDNSIELFSEFACYKNYFMLHWPKKGVSLKGRGKKYSATERNMCKKNKQSKS